MSSNNKKFIELAALLDGEVRDAAQAEKLAQAISDDPGLRAEFEAQRAVKSALGSLPEYSAPDFMATRILGEIAGQHKPLRTPTLRVLVTAFGAFALLVLAFTPLTQFFFAGGPTSNSDELIASQPTSSFIPPEPAFTPQDWREITPPADITDERVLEFLRFANEAHAYRVMVAHTGIMSPDMGQAILVLDTGSSR